MSNKNIKLAIVGVGKIVLDQHLPSIKNVGGFDLIATASRNAQLEGVNAYTSLSEMIENEPALEAVALCMPPQYRFEAAILALKNGLNVLLEKPPGSTVSEVDLLTGLAKENAASLYTTWHSRHAVGVGHVKSLLSAKDTKISSVKMHWKESVRKWHPGQEWIWEPGGLGVFDPGINGLSILTEILPDGPFVKSANLVFPENKSSPIAASMSMSTSTNLSIDVDLDWRVEGDEQWSIWIETSIGQIALLDGGARLLINDIEQSLPEHTPYVEYEAIYREFSSLCSIGDSAVDIAPLKLVADTFMLADRQGCEAFEE